LKSNDAENFILEFVYSVDKELATNCSHHVKKIEQTFKDGDFIIEKDLKSDSVDEETENGG
jgi:hypothetical protein